MTVTPEFLAEKPLLAGPAEAGAPDLLSDLLGTVHISGAVLFRAELGDPWAVDVPGASDLAAMLPFPTEHIVPFHLVEEGSCWMEAGQGERIWLSSGDAVLMPYGSAHRLGGQASAALAPMGAIMPKPPWNELPVVRYGGTGGMTRFVCGFVHCEELLFNPFLRGLPQLLHVRPGQDPAARWLETTIRYTAHEASRADPGARSMLPRLTELMFVEVLRHHMRSMPRGEVGWLAAASDPVLGEALGWIHRAPCDPWTVEDLARRVGVSRTVLVERFAERLGLPPMRYLARWRLQVGAQLLRKTRAPLKAIAERAGYESEAAFGRAFKRLFGRAPAEWRQRARAAS
jgi:AraC-like DNA-binding protein